jgi:hypothetical protein
MNMNFFLWKIGTIKVDAGFYRLGPGVEGTNNCDKNGTTQADVNFSWHRGLVLTIKIIQIIC